MVTTHEESADGELKEMVKTFLIPLVEQRQQQPAAKPTEPEPTTKIPEMSTDKGPYSRDLNALEILSKDQKNAQRMLQIMKGIVTDLQRQLREKAEQRVKPLSSREDPDTTLKNLRNLPKPLPPERRQGQLG
jgi:hypothetical protein